MSEATARPNRADFLVSYTNADQAWAAWIAWQLEDAGYQVVIQAWDFLPGRDWAHEMQQALASVPRVVAVLSPAYLSSEHGEAEWRAFYAADPSGEQARLLPVRVAEVTPPGLLKTRVYIDLVGMDEREARDRLLTAAGGARGKPADAPVFPGLAALQRSTGVTPRFPGALPPIWNVPYQPNPHFTGRRRLLAEIQARLGLPDARVRRVVLTGLGGVGKTQLAAEYAYQHQHEFDLVWWVRAPQPATLHVDLAALAAQPRLRADLHLSAQTPQPEVVARVRAWLERHPRWLLIIDDVSEPAVLLDLLPRTTIGHVLVTSRQATGWAPLASQLAVDVVAPTDAAAFLLARTGQDDQRAAQALAARLGNLPLALEQAAGYLTATGMTLSGYAELFVTRALELLGRGRPLDYEQTVATTWSLAFERLARSHPAAVALLNLLSFCAPDDLPRPLLGTHHHQLPDPLHDAAADPLQLGDAVAALQRYSLVRLTGEGVGMHPLLQLVVRGGLTVDEQHRWARAVVGLLLFAFPNPRHELAAWPQCQRLLSHVLIAVDHAHQLRLEPAEAPAALLNNASAYLSARGQFQQARSMLERAVALHAQTLGADHPATLRSIGNLALDLQRLGELDRARVLDEQVLAARRRVLGEEHPETLLSMHNLAVTLSSLGALDRARALSEQALVGYRRVLGDAHPDTLRSMSTLAETLRLLGELDRARVLGEQAVAARRRVQGDDHPDTLHSIAGLAAVLERLGRLGDARALNEQVLAAYRRVLGDDHPHTLGAMSNLATTLHYSGEREQARALHEQVLAARRRVLGDGHPDTLLSMHNLADTMLALGKLRQALQLNEQALAGYRRVLGDDHPDTLSSMNNLGANLHRIGALGRAHALFEQTLAARRRVLGDDHPDTVVSTNNLAGIRLDLLRMQASGRTGNEKAP